LQKQTHSFITFEYTLTIAGKEKDFEARITAMNSEEVLVIVREITQRKEIERKLIEKKDDNISNYLIYNFSNKNTQQGYNNKNSYVIYTVSKNLHFYTTSSLN
jgi:hypothetical protein